MNSQTLPVPGKERTRRKRKSVSIPPRRDSKIEIKAGSLQNLIERSLKGMAHKLKRGACSTSSHSDCTMKIQIEAEDSKTLLTDFLSRVLELTHTQHTIFGTMYVEEITEEKITAQLYGNWFDSFDNEIRSVVRSGTTLKRNEDGSYDGSIVFSI